MMESFLKKGTELPIKATYIITIMYACSGKGFVPTCILFAVKNIADSSPDYHQGKRTNLRRLVWLKI